MQHRASLPSSGLFGKRKKRKREEQENASLFSFFTGSTQIVKLDLCGVSKTSINERFLKKHREERRNSFSRESSRIRLISLPDLVAMDRRQYRMLSRHLRTLSTPRRSPGRGCNKRYHWTCDRLRYRRHTLRRVSVACAPPCHLTLAWEHHLEHCSMYSRADRRLHSGLRRCRRNYRSCSVKAGTTPSSSAKHNRVSTLTTTRHASLT
jgi:hypothetical protein